MPYLGFERIEWGGRWSVAHGQMGWQTTSVLGVVLFAPGLNPGARFPSDYRDKHPSTTGCLHRATYGNAACLAVRVTAGYLLLRNSAADQS